MKTRSQILAALEAAVDQITPAVGKWVIRSGTDYVQLVWTCDKDATDEMFGDEPWSEWGGNAIIAAASLPDPDDSGTDTYTDKFGEDVVTQWAQRDVCEDADVTITILADEENAAETFFDFVRAADDAPAEILQIAQDGQQVVVTQHRAGELLAWCESAEGWADGPEYARYALLFE